MDWSEVAKTAGTLGLKAIGGALAGPAGSSIGGQVAEWLGLASGSGPDQVDQALSTASPETLLELKRIDAEMEKARIAADVEQSKIGTADIQDARGRDTKLQLAGRENSRANMMIMGDVLGLVLGLAGMITLGWFKARHPESVTEGVFGALLAQLSTFTSYFGLCLRDAHQFEFGSSRGSKDKDLIIKGAGKA